jgi:two-component system phosphate regulon sensor histidine kinase PhoR
LNTTFARMIAGYVLVAIVLAGAWLYSLSGPLTDAVVEQQERNLTAVAQSAALVVGESDERPQQIARQLVARTDLRLTVVASDGVVLADSDFSPSAMENHGNRREVMLALEGTTGVDRRTSATEGYEQLYVAVPGSMEGKRVAVRVAQSLEDVRRIAAGLRRFGLSLLAAAFALAVLIAWHATRSAALPVRELSETSRQMAQGNLSARIPVVPTDLSGLATSLASLRDQMKSRLDALDAERGTLRAALDGLTDAVFVVEGGKVALANRVAGLLAADPLVEGKGLEDLSLPASLKAAIRNQLASPGIEAVELEPDPTGQAWRVLATPLSSSGASVRAIVIVTDITERTRLDRMRREFVANASHELKTPVAAIKLLSESASMAASDGDDESAAVFSGQIAGEVDRLQRLVTDLLDLSRLDALPSAGSITDVRVAVEQALVGHRLAARSKGIPIEADFSAVQDEDAFVEADSTDVAVALDNLLANAIHYTSAGSVRVEVRASEEDVTIAVTDTGPGIAREHLPRIFERFYRVDEGRTRDAGGTGLGLALVRHVAERNGGTISVTSEVGVGSTFALRLPRHR